MIQFLKRTPKWKMIARICFVPMWFGISLAAIFWTVSPLSSFPIFMGGCWAVLASSVCAGRSRTSALGCVVQENTGSGKPVAEIPGSIP